MKSNYEPLGKYIRLVDTRNRSLETKKLLGISIDKYFMPSVANIIGTDLRNYKLISKDLFACNPMHVGRDKRLPIALYTDEDKAIVSPAYFMFEIIDTGILLPEYLMMWFRRSEFDRLCWLKTDASIRGGITWEDFCSLEVPVPDIAVQRSIVQAYNTIEQRIWIKKKINDNLMKFLISLYEAYSKDPNGRFRILGDIATYVTRRRKFGELNEKKYLSNENLLRDKNGISGYSICPDDEVVVEFSPGDTLIGNIRPYFRKIYFCEANGGCNADVLVLRAYDNRLQEMLYCALSQDCFFDYIMSGAKGTKMPRGDKDHILLYEVAIPDDQRLEAFIRASQKAISMIRENQKEQSKLELLQKTLLSTLSNQAIRKM